MSFAKVTIVGHLGDDPQSRYLQSGTLVVSFSIAADGRKRSGQESTTTWFRVSAFGEVAERLANMVEQGHIHKGRMLYVEGQFEASTYTGNDGTQRTSNDVNLTDWKFLGAGNTQTQDNGNQSQTNAHHGHHKPYNPADHMEDQVPF